MIYKKIVKTRYTRLKARYFGGEINVVKKFSTKANLAGCRRRKFQAH